MAQSTASRAQTEPTDPNRSNAWRLWSEHGTGRADPSRARSKQRDWTTFEWLEGGFFLVEGWRLSAGPGENTGIAIVGYDDPNQTCLAHYLDNEGRFDTYELDLRDSSLKITWELYRFAGTLSADGNTIRGTWEQSSDGSHWEY